MVPLGRSSTFATWTSDRAPYRTFSTDIASDTLDYVCCTRWFKLVQGWKLLFSRRDTVKRFRSNCCFRDKSRMTMVGISRRSSNAPTFSPSPLNYRALRLIDYQLLETSYKWDTEIWRVFSVESWGQVRYRISYNSTEKLGSNSKWRTWNLTWDRFQVTTIGLLFDFWKVLSFRKI